MPSVFKLTPELHGINTEDLDKNDFLLKIFGFDRK